MTTELIAPAEIRAGAELRFIADDGSNPKVAGHAAVYNAPSNPIPSRAGGFTEILAPGAFGKSDLRDVKLLIEHRGLPLADTGSGTLSVTADERGLAFEGMLDPTDPDAARVIPKLSRGTLRHMSFAMYVASKGDKWESRGGTVYRTIHTISKVDDVSIVTRPAYNDTSAVLRSLDAFLESVETVDDVKATDETKAAIERLRRKLALALVL
jgi:HK97 family phage prohead protease